MKKLLVVCMAMMIGTTTSSGQDDFDRGIFNHLGVNLSAGTEGIGIGVATPITNYLELGFDVNIMPGFKAKGDVNVIYNTGTIPVPLPTSEKVRITGDLQRTMMDVKLSVYPFGGKTPFFIAGGFSFGGEKIAILNGHSDVVQEAIRTYPEYKTQILDGLSAELDKYNVKFDENGDVNGDVRVKKFRPYVGLGFGRLVPKNRVGFRFELGCQFMGKMKVYQNDTEVKINEMSKGDDDLSKIIDKFTVYPVLKFTLTGRIL
jgi:hypothetical protein